MTAAPAMPLTELYEADETAWLDAMAMLIAERRTSEFDLPNLQEFLESMANRDRRETFSRMVVLLVHLLKWEYQPDRRSDSWTDTIRNQRFELELLLESGTLSNHIREEFERAYGKSRKQVSQQTSLDIDVFPFECPWTLEQILADDDA